MPGNKSAGDTERFIWHEGEAEMKVIQMQCRRCKHFAGGLHPSCQAFPNSIPGQIYLNKVDHRQPFDGDQGIRWEPLEPGTKHPFDDPLNPG